jgi:hypothetical protein
MTIQLKWIKQHVQEELVKSSKLTEGIHYIINEDGRVVFTALYLIQQQKCCGNGCTNCPYSPKHTKGNLVLSKQ